jgi:predicted alpha/beta superfamily hydrolase
MDWIVGTLKPYIDGKYRTYAFREATGIGGSSMGGLMSLFAVTAYNSTFSKAACVSSTLFIVRDRLFDEIEYCRISPDTRVYFSWGEKESGQNTDFARLLSRINYDAQDLLSSKGALTQVFFQVGGGHCEADWEKQVPGFMEFLWL